MLLVDYWGLEGLFALPCRLHPRLRRFLRLRLSAGGLSGLDFLLGPFLGLRKSKLRQLGGQFLDRQLSTLEGRPTVLSRLRRMAISSGRRNQVSAILMPRLYLTSKARTRRSEMDNSEAACLVLIRVLRSIMGWCAGSDHLISHCQLPGNGLYFIIFYYFYGCMFRFR